MLREIFLPLVKFFTPFNLFQYITFRAAYAAVGALLISFLFGPSIIRMLRRLKAGQEIREDGPQTHLVKSGTPTMGGVMIVLAVTVVVLLLQNLGDWYTWTALLSFLAFGLVGFADDFLKVAMKNSKGLPAKVKLIGQIVVGLAVGLVIYLHKPESAHATVLYLPFFKGLMLDLDWLYIPFSMLLLVSSTNAVNLTDGLDGLATGLVLMVALAFAALAYIVGRADFAAYLDLPYLAGAGELSIFCLALVGACVGFLWYNTHPAEVMMGDTGSLALGGALGTVALLIKKEILLFIIGGVFVLETLSVIIQVVSYKTRKKRVFLMAPLHHHFELKGWPETKVVTRFWILGGLFLILGLSTLKIR